MENDIVTFKLHLQGAALEDHSIDAKELGEALVGLEETLGLIAYRLTGTKQKFLLRVQGDLRPGSLTTLLKFAVDAVGCSPALFADAVSATKSAIECLTLLIQLCKEFQSQPVTRDDVDRVSSGVVFNNCIINNFSDQSKNVAQQIHNTGTAAKPLKAMFSPLAPNHQVEKMEFLDSQGAPFVQSDRKEYDKMFSLRPVESIERQSMLRMPAELLGIRFDDNSLTISADGNVYKAKIADQDFLGQIESGEISFSAGMTAVVDVQQTTTLKNGRTTASYEITKICDIRRKDEDLF